MNALRKLWQMFMVKTLLAFFIFFSGGTIDAGEKITIGAVEEVILLPWGIQVPARIDTGAATSSLDVCEIKKTGRKEIEFRLPERCGGNQVRMPVVAWRIIQSTEGIAEHRPVVEIKLCLGSKQFRTQVTLNDRSKMEYPLLIGRRALEGNFIVDVSRSKIVPPHCSEDQSP
jgi:hypothetical protein